MSKSPTFWGKIVQGTIFFLKQCFQGGINSEAIISIKALIVRQYNAKEKFILRLLQDTCIIYQYCPTGPDS